MASPQYPPGTIASQQADGVTPGLQIASPAALAPGNGKNPPIVPNAHGPTAALGVPGDHTYHAPGGSPHDLAGTEPLTAGSLVLQDPVFLQGLQQLVTEAVSGSMQAFSDRSSRSRSRYSSSSSDSGSGDDDHSHYRRHRRHKRSRSPLHRHRDDETHYSPRSRSHSTSRDHRPTSPAASGSQIRDDVSLFATSISEFQERVQEQEGIQGLTPEHKEEEVVTSPPNPYDLLTSMEPRETGVLVSDKLLSWFRKERCLLFSQQGFNEMVKPYKLDQSQLEDVSTPNLQPLLRDKWEKVKHSVQAVKHDDTIRNIQEQCSPY
ncbi:Hypp6568 [Branchiostoma lanceolatum]|uniref:Hypp6568 protein n=1 Tax=Branchiostoma lanceolatum TaxID=7740 RepID=A0A8K0EAX3_BRALA|nr:Hypp6568 [Branchiostoma lanceolatum]